MYAERLLGGGGVQVFFYILYTIQQSVKKPNSVTFSLEREGRGGGEVAHSTRWRRRGVKLN